MQNSKTTDQLLEFAVADTTTVLGIGGYIPSQEFGMVFDQIDASTFAKIMYPSDYMMEDFKSPESVNPKNIIPTIEKYNFEEMEHFDQIVKIFEKYFGSDILQY